jgi:FkbM family methyltransferase
MLEAARFLTIARDLGVPPAQVLEKRWRDAVRATRWQLVPRRIRDNIQVACDVGANRGDWTDAILRLASPRRVYAFEPIPDLAASMKKRFAAQPQVTVTQAAVGAQPGKVDFRIEAASELSSILPFAAGGRAIHGDLPPPTIVQVPLVTLDEALAHEPRIQLLKVDVQGFEREVVTGARETLKRCECLSIEVQYERDYYTGAETFLPLARRIEEETPLRLSCVSEPAVTPAGLGVWADAIFVNPAAT